MLISNQQFLGLKGVVPIIFCCILIGFSGLVGMGDVKLVLLFSPWLQRENCLATTFVLLAIAWAQIVVTLVRDRSLPQKVAFAPAILLALAVNMAS
jgi:Flp pilus assembly protein protease CpaA